MPIASPCRAAASEGDREEHADPFEEQLPPAACARTSAEHGHLPGRQRQIIDKEYLGTLRFPAEVPAAGEFILDEECLPARQPSRARNGQTRELLLATHDTPDALRCVGGEAERRRIAGGSASRPPPNDQSRGIFA